MDKRQEAETEAGPAVVNSSLVTNSTNLCVQGLHTMLRNSARPPQPTSGRVIFKIREDEVPTLLHEHPKLGKSHAEVVTKSSSQTWVSSLKSAVPAAEPAFIYPQNN